MPAPQRRALSPCTVARAATRATSASLSATRARTSPARPTSTASGWWPTPCSAIPRCATPSPPTTTCASPRPDTARASMRRSSRRSWGPSDDGSLRSALAAPPSQPRHDGLAHARQQSGPPSPAGRRTHRCPHQRHPVLERQLARDEPAKRARDGSLHARLLECPREQRNGLERLDRLADARGYLRRGDPGGEQLAGAPVAAFARQSRRDQVAGPSEADHGLGTRAQILRVAPNLGA